jgi:AraC-like DNA-binding protein
MKSYNGEMEIQILMIPNTGTRVLLLEAKRRGVNIDMLILSQKLDPKALMEDPDYLIPSPALRAIWKDLHEISGDPLLALHAAQVVPENAYPVTDHLVRAAANVNDAFLSVSRYWKVTIPSLQMDFKVGSAGAVFELSSFTPSGIEVPREMIEYTFALNLHRIRRFSTKAWAPIRVEFQGKYEAGSEEHERVFGCPVTFDAETNRIYIDKPTLEIKQVKSDPSLFSLLTRFADQELKKMGTKPVAPSEPIELEDTQGRVRQALQASLSTSDISVEAVATQLGMSSRTLQRKLEAESTSYQEVLDKLRMELAESFLKERALGKMTVDDISFLLGFSEPSAFYKAYKRWTGRSLPGKSAA